jgi:hypothetical protein
MADGLNPKMNEMNSWGAKHSRLNKGLGMILSELPELNRKHLAWRLDHKTACGYLTACRIARLETEHKNMQVFEVFVWAGKSERAAKIHAKKVINFKMPN